MSEETGSPLPCWADVAFMGHVHFVGYVSEIEMAGAKLLKVEPISPADGTPEPASYWPPTNLYSLQPRAEDEIRAEIGKRRAYALRRQQMYAPPQLEEVEREAEEPHVYEGDDDVYDEPEGF